jgi:hypothetical protein
MDLHTHPARPMPEAGREIGCFSRLASATQQRVESHRLSASPGYGIVRPLVGSRYSLSLSDSRGAASCLCSRLDLGAPFSNRGRRLCASVRYAGASSADYTVAPSSATSGPIAADSAFMLPPLVRC